MRLQLRINSGVSIMSKPSLAGREQQQSSPFGLGHKQAKKPKKYGANAPQLHHIFFAPAWRAAPDQGAREKPKKYGANAPYLHHIFPV
jgi:hypothetical protein